MSKPNFKKNLPTSRFESEYFDEEELKEVFLYYPENYKSNLDKFYKAFQEYAAPLLGMYNEIADFLEFCKCTCRVYSSVEEAEKEFEDDLIKGESYLRIGGIVSGMSRALYYEVSNHNLKDNNIILAEISSMVDCLHNRVLTKKDKDFKEALLELDGLNPTYRKPDDISWDELRELVEKNKKKYEKYYKYWNELNMRTPVKSASGGNKHVALVYAYAISVVCYKYYRTDMLDFKYEWPKFSASYGVDLPKEYVHFSEGEKATKYSDKKVGLITFLTQEQYNNMYKARKHHKKI